MATTLVLHQKSTRVANDSHVRAAEGVQRSDGGEDGAIDSIALVIENVHVAAKRPHLRVCEGEERRKNETKARW